MTSIIKTEFKNKLKEIKEYEAGLIKKDKNFKNAVFFELLYDEIVERTKTDLERLLYVNQYLLSKNMNLKTTNVNMSKNNSTTYYTINGAQFICVKQAPKIYIPGRVFRENIDTKKISFCDSHNIVWKHLRNDEKYIDHRYSDPTLNKKGQEFYNFIFKLIVGTEIDAVFNSKNDKYVKEMIARDNIAFQAINNGIEEVEKIITEYKKNQ